MSANWIVDNFSIPVCGVDDVACLTSPSDSSVQYGDIDILNLHFHANSEHTQRGRPYGAEAHLVVNVTTNGISHLVVFGTWMDVKAGTGTTNDFLTDLQPYIDKSSGTGCTPVQYDVKLYVDLPLDSEEHKGNWQPGLFPLDKEYFAYRGSLTTPPCAEDVTWIVFTHPLSINQLKTLYRANAYTSQPCGRPTTNQLCNVLGARTNNRIVQPSKDRPIYIGSVSAW
ncbi:hypothetical protein WJX75_000464 [Coccomyxa subellipsoidea]|uniref:carbonic anhydrase n=1 Tax=Coccomyxa subellipsoidea TaxID=248742 RepID=A0ABR2YSX1_9CHLO